MFYQFLRTLPMTKYDTVMQSLQWIKMQEKKIVNYALKKIKKARYIMAKTR